MKRSSLFITMFIITLLALLTVLSNILSSLASSQIPSAFIPYLRLAWPALGLVTLLTVGFTVWLYFRQQSSQTIKAMGQTEQESTSKRFGKLVVYIVNLGILCRCDYLMAAKFDNYLAPYQHCLFFLLVMERAL